MCLVAEEESRSGFGDYSPKSLPRLLRKASIVLTSRAGLLLKGACHDEKNLRMVEFTAFFKVDTPSRLHMPEAEIAFWRDGEMFGVEYSNTYPDSKCDSSVRLMGISGGWR